VSAVFVNAGRVENNHVEFFYRLFCNPAVIRKRFASTVFILSKPLSFAFFFDCVERGAAYVGGSYFFRAPYFAAHRENPP
jgi:hypothetical protein